MMQAYQVRSLLYEFGVAAPKGFRALKAKLGPVLAHPTGSPVPELVRAELLNQLEGLSSLSARIEELEHRIGGWQRRETECARPFSTADDLARLARVLLNDGRLPRSKGAANSCRAAGVEQRNG
jgi:hypothetical protein